MANPTGTLNADESHSTRKISNVAHPPVADHDAATKKYVDDNVSAATTFLGLSDTPNSYAGQVGRYLRVNSGETALEYVLPLLIGTNVEAWDADLDSIAALTGINIIPYRSAANTWGSVTVGSGLSFSSGTLSATGGGSGTVTTTGTPATGNLSKFSGATSITNGDLTGDVTTSGTLATTIANNAVSLGKMATVATDSILGRATAATGNVEVLTALPFAFTGDVTRPADSNAQTIANSAVTYAKMQNVSANSKLLGSSATGSGAPPSEITLGTNLSMSGGTLNAAGGGGTSTHAVTFVADGMGTALTTGAKNPIKIPYGGTLTGWVLIGTPSGSITIDILRAADGAGLPVTSIIGGGGTKPALSSAVENSSTSFTGWTSTTLTAKDNMAISLSGITAITYLALTLYYQ
jgi:Repeat of unknown function (DUF5907)